MQISVVVNAEATPVQKRFHPPAHSACFQHVPWPPRIGAAGAGSVAAATTDQRAHRQNADILFTIHRTRSPTACGIDGETNLIQVCGNRRDKWKTAALHDAHRQTADLPSDDIGIPFIPPDGLWSRGYRHVLVYPCRSDR